MKKLFLTVTLLGLSALQPTLSLAASRSVIADDVFIDDINDGLIDGFEDEGMVSGWCHNRMMILNSYRERAEMFSMQYDFATSASILMAGLQRAQSTGPTYQGALTYKAIVRSLETAKKIEVALPDSAKKSRVLNYILFQDYDFISEVSRDFDIRFYDRSCHDYCHHKEAPDFETQFQKFSQRQVDVVLDNLFIQSDVVYPVGSASVALTVLKSALIYHLSDLQESMWSDYYSCQIIELASLIRRINSQSFPNQMMAVQYAYHEARGILTSEGGCSNGSDYHDRD